MNISHTVNSPDSFTGDRWTASEDFPNIPLALNRPYLYWTIGATPAEEWSKAVAADRVAQDIPANHMGNFVPDFEPTVHAATTAATAAVLTYLGTTTEVK